VLSDDAISNNAATVYSKKKKGKKLKKKKTAVAMSSEPYDTLDSHQSEETAKPQAQPQAQRIPAVQKAPAQRIRDDLDAFGISDDEDIL